MCAGCRLHPSRPRQRYCLKFHAIYQKAYRQRRHRYVRELQAIIDELTGKNPATEDTWRKVVGSRHVLVVPPEDSLADVFAGPITRSSKIKNEPGCCACKANQGGAVANFAHCHPRPATCKLSPDEPRRRAAELPKTAGGNDLMTATTNCDFCGAGITVIAYRLNERRAGVHRGRWPGRVCAPSRWAG